MYLRHCIVLAVFLAAASAFAQRPPAQGRVPLEQCRRADALVAEVKAMWAAGNVDHRAALARLRTAYAFCPGNGEAYKYGHCSAVAIGDAQLADFFKRRAAATKVESLDCTSASLPATVRRKFALVIGIGTFRDPAIPRLQFAAKDAGDFARALTEHAHFSPSDVTLLTDAQATRAAILRAIQQLILRAQEDDLVVLFVSSHGSPSRKDGGLGGAGHIVTYDTSSAELWADAIEYADFAAKTALIKARRRVAFLDTCYSGLVAQSGARALTIEHAGVDERTAKMFLSGEGTSVITSSKATERSWESETIRNGYFTHYLIDALKRSSEPVTVKELFDSIALRVPEAVAREKNEPQHPQMHPPNGPGEVRIGVVPRERQ